MERVLNMCLCENRHEIGAAIDGAIFRNITDIANTIMLEEKAFLGIWDAAFRHFKNHESGFLESDPEWDGSDMEPLKLSKALHINLYVTGLTVALIATLNVCRREGIDVTLYHFNKDTEEYFPQEVL